MTKLSFRRTGTGPAIRPARLMRWWPAALAFLLILLLSGVFLPYPGLQNDEVLFAQPLYIPGGAQYSAHIGGARVPVMLLNYLGAWKTWVYAPILKHWRPSAASVRWPAVAICGLTVCIFFQLLLSLHGWRAAAVGTLLLATDSSFLLTGAFDWGPVAFQHLFLTSALALGLFFHKTGSLRALGLAAFCAGLGLWDKALFLWPLSGVVIASIAIAPKAWKPTRSKVLTAALGFVIGAFPFLAFNISHHFVTFRSNGHFTLSEFPQKFEVLKRTTNGSILFGFLVNEESAPNPRPAETRTERWSAALHDAAGDHRTNWMPAALLGSLVLLPFLWRTRARPAMLFALIACAVAWLQMAVTENAGGSAHHAVLLWPLPALFVALAIAELSLTLKRAGALAAAALSIALITGNLLNLNQCFYQLARYGPAGDWTDATNALSAGVSNMSRATPFMAGDWGIFNILTVLHRGTLNLQVGHGPFESQPSTPAQKQAAMELLSTPGAVWIRFVAGREQFTGINGRFDQMAAEAGYRKTMLAEIRDRNQRPAFELFRLER